MSVGAEVPSLPWLPGQRTVLCDNWRVFFPARRLFWWGWSLLAPPARMALQAPQGEKKTLQSVFKDGPLLGVFQTPSAGPQLPSVLPRAPLRRPLRFAPCLPRRPLRSAPPSSFLCPALLFALPRHCFPRVLASHITIFNALTKKLFWRRG